MSKSKRFSLIDAIALTVIALCFVADTCVPDEAAPPIVILVISPLLVVSYALATQNVFRSALVGFLSQVVPVAGYVMLSGIRWYVMDTTAMAIVGGVSAIVGAVVAFLAKKIAPRTADVADCVVGRIGACAGGVSLLFIFVIAATIAFIPRHGATQRFVFGASFLISFSVMCVAIGHYRRTLWGKLLMVTAGLYAFHNLGYVLGWFLLSRFSAPAFLAMLWAVVFMTFAVPSPLTGATGPPRRLGVCDGGSCRGGPRQGL